MLFEQYYLSCLAHGSYLIGSEGEAAVVDPQRDIEIYLDAAREHGLRIRHVIETHLHADFVSGHHELAGRTGAAIYLGPGSDAAFPHVAVKDGDEVRFGRCILRFFETPGHTLESITVLVTDLDRSPEPFAALTGDTLFVGDVGRPDLSPTHTPQQLAALLYRSLFEKLLKLPDQVQVFPAHGAGSLCGRQMSSERFSTIGKERASNPMLRVASEEEFVARMTADLPPRPEYFFRDVELNRQGAEALSNLPLPPALAPEQVRPAGAVILDTRPLIEFAAAHVPGSIHIGLSGQYASWAARLIGLDTDIVLVAEDTERVRESQIRLARVGIQRVCGYLAQGVTGWARAGLPLEQMPQVSVQELHRQLQDPDGLVVLDVREKSEWAAGTIAGSVRIPLGELAGHVEELSRDALIAVHCKSGYRSSIAASLLQKAGFVQVANVTGGFDAWKGANLPLELPRGAPQSCGA